MSANVAAFVREKLGHEPRDLTLFELALTHSSVGGDNYERLEFLGDRVLGDGHRQRPLRTLPERARRQSLRRYNALVDRETCAENGRELGLPGFIRLGKQAREDGASQSDNVVGDVVEALIGALYLDGGFEAAQRFILRLGGRTWRASGGRPSIRNRRCRSSPPPRASGRPPTKWCRTGAHHAPKFTIQVSVAEARRSDCRRH